MFKGVSQTNKASTSPATVNNNSSVTREGFRGRGTTFTRRPGRQKLTGLFANGIWHCDCDCDPRLPAEHFQVKKESANKGRWFYTCQNGEGRRCGFFLWDDDAKPREAAAVLSNSRTEPRTSPNMPLSPIHQSPRTTQSSPNSASTPSHTSRVMKRPISETGFDDADDHDSYPWSLSGQEEVDLFNAPETPHKAVKFNNLATPETGAQRKLPWLDHTTRISSETSANAVPNAGKSPPPHQIKTPHSKLPAVQQAALTPQVTPSPLRFREPSADVSPSRSALTADVFAALDSSNITLPVELASRLKDVLTRHELRFTGMSKGREITRLALKAREAKITELQATIMSLEAEREVDHARVRSLEWERDMLAKHQDCEADL